MNKKVVIVGAGVAGLAAAARLGSRGYRVEVYEKLAECGGRAHVIEDSGFAFDTGPSFVLMPAFFEELFSYCKRNLNDYLDLKPLDIHYKIFYPNGKTLTVYRDTQKTKAELERIEPDSCRAYDKFIADVGDMYGAVKPLLYRCFTPARLCNPFYWGLLWKLKTHKTYWQIAGDFFKSDELRQAFTFEAMFIGVSPHHAPAFYSVITYADHVEKIYHPLGGMYQIPKALEQLAKEYNVRFHYNQEIEKIVRRNGSLLICTPHIETDSDIAVVNADYVYAQKKLLQRPIGNYKYSCSTYLLYLGLNKKISGLEHHNLFFSRDLNKNLNDIFRDHQIPDDPSFYVHVPTVTDPSMAPLDKEIVYVLVPVPNLERARGHFSEHEQKIRALVFRKINQVIGERIQDSIEIEHVFYPEDFLNRYNVYQGATFGLAHTLMQSAFFRPANIDKTIKNLYYVGCSSQPGEGLPPVIASSRIVADLIEARDN